MPNWKIHLEIGKRVNEELKYSEKEYQMFLLGNILPDINNSFLVKNISVELSHQQTHLVNKQKKSYEIFYEKYKDKMESNPIVKGYYIHLLTDYIWNNDFYSKYNIKDGDSLQNHRELRKLKQDDFKKYNNKFLENCINIETYEEALNKTNIIEEVSINKNDIIEVQNFLREQKPKQGEYNFYTEKELDDLMKKTVWEICGKLNELKKV